MEFIKQQDLDLIVSCGGQDVNDADFQKLKDVYAKLKYICELLEKNGYEYQIRQDPRKQSGTGRFVFQEYHWAKIYPKEFYWDAKDKFAYIIGFSDTLHFHMMGIKEYQNLKPSLEASKKCWRQIDINSKSYDDVITAFSEFDKYNRSLFIKTGDNLGIKKFKQIVVKMKNTERIKLLEYKKQIILQGPPGTGKTREAKLIAKEILGLVDEKELKDNEQFNLIQFHPSYTYEDFVRGIVAKPSPHGEGVVYEAENKTLGVFAKRAQINYQDYLLDRENLTFEDWTIGIANEYLSHIKEKLETTEKKYYLNESSAYIFKINKDSISYNNDEWGGAGFELTFKTFYKCCMDDRMKVKLMSPETALSKLPHVGNMGDHLVRDFWVFQDLKPSFVEATKTQLKNYILIIDEINRANLPSVLGELIYALEYRGEVVESMYNVDGNELTLPPNLYIIGTMNTADRSVGHIDYAIKRRFAFVDVLPEIDPVHPLIKEEFIKISNLFVKNFDGTFIPKSLEQSESLARDFRPEDIWIGHSYFICKKENSPENEDDDKAKPILDMKLKYEIIPLLKEYIKDGILLETEQVKNVMNDLISKNFS